MVITVVLRLNLGPVMSHLRSSTFDIGINYAYLRMNRHRNIKFRKKPTKFMVGNKH